MYGFVLDCLILNYFGTILEHLYVMEQQIQERTNTKSMLEQNLKTQPLIFNNVVASLTKVGLLALSNKELGVGKELRMGAIMEEVGRCKGNTKRQGVGRTKEVQQCNRKEDKGHISPFSVFVVSYGVQEAITLTCP